MNSFLLNRQLGSISQQTLATAYNDRLIQSLQLAPKVQFTAQTPVAGVASNGVTGDATVGIKAVAHVAGVNSIDIDIFEGRYLLSGGSDSSVAIWDLEADAQGADDATSIHVPLGHVPRTSISESLGITHLAFYPFDSGAFLTGGYDRSLKLFSSDTLTASATFDMGSTVFSHATSNVATHLLVAVASQHPAVRLVDLRVGSSTHSLAGHSGSVLSVAWHPKNENILASGATDGSCRVWDIRRSASSLGVLDLEDSVGIVGYDGLGTGARRRERGKSHNGAVNGLSWSQKGEYLVSTGLDERMRVWDMTMGANTLANFGPVLQNTQTTLLQPLFVPKHFLPAGNDVIFYRNPGEILSFDMHSGSLLKRLRVPGMQKAPSGSGIRNISNRTTALAWRAHAIEMYSAHADGLIRCWRPRTWEDASAEQSEDVSGEDEPAEAAEKKRKREELDGIVHNLTKKKVTYT
ncbi:DNA excision repair protein ERCC-8 [Teratosphaeria destructans]|uniref:DNA excision repair protein ERCC-8 n=1 Tax=Teratosphaeria destructans TaxID=418781 RepID=A0A9W7W6D7_9PEZI|nr:DNA excision repair protein ERCC-8 [Teratosphaeria destructans]